MQFGVALCADFALMQHSNGRLGSSVIAWLSSCLAVLLLVQRFEICIRLTQMYSVFHFARFTEFALGSWFDINKKAVATRMFDVKQAYPKMFDV